MKKVTLLALLAIASCGGDSAECGNGKLEDGEQCDDGNTDSGDGCSSTCRSEASIDTFVEWVFVTQEFPNFGGETCLGLDIAQVKVTVTGPKTVTQTTDCSLAQIKLSELPAGAYTVTAVALDASGAQVSNGLASATFTAGTSSQNVKVNFPFADFTRPYAGTFYFNVRFGGVQSCGDADLPVARERITMTRAGAPVAGATTTGVPLGGGTTGPCGFTAESGPQQANDVAWGPAHVVLSGEDADGTVLYSGEFDTFVGAGLVNDTFTFDLPRVLPIPDGGVRADGGVTDGGV